MCICVYCKYRRCVHMFVCTCICLCIHGFMCVCVSVWMCAHLHVCIWRPEGYLHVVSRTISIEDTSHDRQRLSLASKSQADEVGLGSEMRNPPFYISPELRWQCAPACHTFHCESSGLPQVNLKPKNLLPLLLQHVGATTMVRSSCLLRKHTLYIFPNLNYWNCTCLVNLAN